MAAKTDKLEKFYHSTLWRKTRKAYLESVYYTCSKCGGVGNLVHHKIPLNDENVEDLTISISFDNLQCLCKSCHDSIHHEIEGRGESNLHHEVSFDEYGNVKIVDR